MSHYDLDTRAREVTFPGNAASAAPTNGEARATASSRNGLVSIMPFVAQKPAAVGSLMPVTNSSGAQHAFQA